MGKWGKRRGLPRRSRSVAEAKAGAEGLRAVALSEASAKEWAGSAEGYSWTENIWQGAVLKIARISKVPAGTRKLW
jgi:hypothetical protein